MVAAKKQVSDITNDYYTWDLHGIFGSVKSAIN